jgi:hypothetical protein
MLFGDNVNKSMKHIETSRIVRHIGYGYTPDNMLNYSYAIIQDRGDVLVIPIKEFAEGYKSV